MVGKAGYLVLQGRHGFPCGLPLAVLQLGNVFSAAKPRCLDLFDCVGKMREIFR